MTIPTIINDQSQLSYKSNFISWLGNSADANVNLTDIIFYVLIGLLAFTVLLLWVFKRKIASHQVKVENNYKLKTNQDKAPWNVWMTVTGIIALGFLIARTIAFIKIGYPRTWEALPLHMCRLIAVFICFVLIFNKKDLMKYILPVALITGVIGLVFKDANISFQLVLNDKNAEHPITLQWLDAWQGDNKYYWLPGGAGAKSLQWANDQIYTIRYTVVTMIWWDLILLHIFTILCPIVVVSVYPVKYGLREVILTWLLYLIVLFFVIGIDMALALSSDVPSNWKANYWYLGFDMYNHFYNFINIPVVVAGQNVYLSSWPTMIGTYYLIGVVWVLIFSFFAALQDKIVFFENKKFIQFKKSDEFSYWVSSWKKRLI